MSPSFVLNNIIFKKYVKLQEWYCKQLTDGKMQMPLSVSTGGRDATVRQVVVVHGRSYTNELSASSKNTQSEVIK